GGRRRAGAPMGGGWTGARARDRVLAGVEWNRRIDVETITLDTLIERFGMPAFVKIDVEGSEPSVLAGLSRPVRSLSFEYLPRALEHVRACAARLRALGRYRFNWSSGESYRLASHAWMSETELCAARQTAAAQRRPGDVHAQLDVS